MPIKIAVDAMGGDSAPKEVVQGALLAAAERAEIQIILVGDEGRIRAALDAPAGVRERVTVRHAAQAIGMDEHPAQAVRRKRDSSLVVCGLMVRGGEADATFSAGNTGAAMTIATLDIGRIPGIERPAIATTLPTLQGRTLLLDAGANVDCSPQNLVQFALLGAIYADRVMGIPNPRVGLLNIGSEEAKGNDLTRETHQRLKSAPINFFGNVEGKDVFEHAVDVVVCDGFAGNILLKAAEGVAELIFDLLQREIDADADSRNSLEGFTPIFERLLQRVHYSEFGGAPLLGVNGVSFIGHGRSNAKAVASGICAAAVAAGSGYVQAIRDMLPAAEARP